MHRDVKTLMCCMKANFLSFIAGIVFVVDGAGTKPSFDESIRKLVQLLPTVSIDETFEVPSVIYNGDQVRTYPLKTPKDVDSVIKRLQALPYEPSSKPRPLQILRTVDELTKGKRMKVIPLGKLYPPSPEAIPAVKSIIKSLEKRGIEFEFFTTVEKPEFWFDIIRYIGVYKPNRMVPFILDYNGKPSRPRKTKAIQIPEKRTRKPDQTNKKLKPKPQPKASKPGGTLG